MLEAILIGALTLLAIVFWIYCEVPGDWPEGHKHESYWWHK